MTYLELLQEEAVLTGEVEKLRGNVTGLSGYVSDLPRLADYDCWEPLEYAVIQFAADAGEFDRAE